MTYKSIRFKTFSLIILVSLIPVLCLHFISTSLSTRESLEREGRFLQILRDEKLTQAAQQYDRTLRLLRESGRATALRILRTRKEGNESEYLYGINDALIRTYYFDPERRALDFQSFQDQDLVAVQRELSARLFSSPEAVAFLSLPENTPVLCRYEKRMENGIVLGYTADLLDFSFAAPLLTVPDSYHIDIYDEEFALILSSAGKQTGTVTVNDLTKRMLDGYSELREYDREYHSFGYAPMGETALYLTVYRETDLMKERGGIQTTALVFFLLTLSGTAYICAWKLYKEILLFAESLLIKNRYDGRIKFFKRMRDNLSQLTEDISVIGKVDRELKYMGNDISHILEMMEEHEENDD